jgi:hypothetical protein
MPLDSYLWRKVLWAEGSVLFFNTVLNKSHEWGTLPIHSYFTSILPRAFIVLYPVVLFASFAVRRLRVTSVACLLFISLYSLLPHKELRFVLPVFPMMLAPVASLFAEHVTSYRRLMPCLLILLLHGYVALTFAWASSHNYPGADALRIVHEVALGSRRPGEACPATVSIFIDDFAAMTGISRFTQLRTAHTAGCFDADPASFVYEKNPAFFNSSCANCDYGNPARPFDFVIARASDQAWHANHSVYHVIRAVRQLSQVSWRQVPPRLDFSDYLLVLQKSHR